MLSIAIDAIDQKKTRWPLTASEAKALQALWWVKVKLTGVIIHEDRSYVYLTNSWITAGSNLTLVTRMNLFTQKEFEHTHEAFYPVGWCKR